MAVAKVSAIVAAGETVERSGQSSSMGDKVIDDDDNCGDRIGTVKRVCVFDGHHHRLGRARMEAEQTKSVVSRGGGR